jgi:hypothetical protein
MGCGASKVSPSFNTLTGHSSNVRALAVSPDGRTLYSGSDDKSIKVWGLPGGECVKTLTGHSDWVGALAVSPDGRTLCSGSSDRSIKVWGLPGGECVKTLTGHSSGYVRALAVSLDGRTLHSGSSYMSIKVWHSLSLDNRKAQLIELGLDSKQAEIAISNFVYRDGTTFTHELAKNTEADQAYDTLKVHVCNAKKALEDNVVDRMKFDTKVKDYALAFLDTMSQVDKVAQQAYTEECDESVKESHTTHLEEQVKILEEEIEKVKHHHEKGVLTLDEMRDALVKRLLWKDDDVIQTVHAEMPFDEETMIKLQEVRRAPKGQPKPQQDSALETKESSNTDAFLNSPGKWDFFLSHYQAETTVFAEALYGSLVVAGYTVWFDVKMSKRSEAERSGAKRQCERGFRGAGSSSHWSRLNISSVPSASKNFDGLATMPLVLYLVSTERRRRILAHFSRCAQMTFEASATSTLSLLIATTMIFFTCA